MNIRPIKTKKFLPPKDNLDDLIDVISQNLKEKDIAIITSKVVSICEGRCIPVSEYETKQELGKVESDLHYTFEFAKDHTVLLTLKNGILIASAGADKSNGNGYYTLWPKDPKASAKKIYKLIKEKTNLKEFGVVITDSHTLPFRRGLMGFSIAYFGFKPLIDDRGKKDLFNYEMHMTQRNIPDTLSAAAVFLMGESGEQTPVAVVSDLPPEIEFTDQEYKPRGEYSSFEIPFDEDIYSVFFKSVKWEKGGGGVK